MVVFFRPRCLLSVGFCVGRWWLASMLDIARRDRGYTPSPPTPIKGVGGEEVYVPYVVCLTASGAGRFYVILMGLTYPQFAGHDAEWE